MSSFHYLLFGLTPKLSYSNFHAHLTITNSPYLSFSSGNLPIYGNFYFTTDYLNNLISLKEEIDSYAACYNLPVFDARKAFFIKVSDSIIWMYLSTAFQLVAFRVNQENLPNLHDLFHESELIHLNNLYLLDKDRSDVNKIFVKNYLIKLKMHMIFDVWVCFESSLQAIFETFISDSERNEIKNEKFDVFLKKLGAAKSELNQSIIQIAKDKTSILDEENIFFESLNVVVNYVKRELASDYIPLEKKWNALFKKINERYFVATRSRHALSDQIYNKKIANQIIETDRKFLRFFNDMRNTTHNNGVPLKSKTYNTRIGIYHMKEGIPLDFVSEEFVIKSIRELAQIYFGIVNCLNDYKPTIYESTYLNRVESKL